ncbi:MAG: DUF1223 domain-containing protein [Vicinamibacterales bacterium]
MRDTRWWLGTTVLAALGAAAVAVPWVSRASAAPEGPRTPVIVELFTSEGCSSCPPADRLLRHLAEAQPVDGAEVIVLSEHVDYWNRLGWRDPFSSSVFTGRQTAYVSRLGAESLYTPQAVVDGAFEMIGNDQPAVLEAVRKAARRPKVALDVAVVPAGADGIRVSVSSGPIAGSRLDLLIAVTERDLTVKVTRGENARKTLAHTGVVRYVRASTGLDGRQPLETPPLEIALDRAWSRDALRVVAFAQSAGQGPVLGIGTAAVPAPDAR